MSSKAFVVAVLTAAALAAGWIAPADVQAADKVRVQLNWVPEPEFGGLYAAEQAGIFKKHNLDVQILKGGPDVPAVQLTASGKVEFGVAAADEVISLRAKGADILGIFTIYQTSPQGIMVKKDRPVKDIPALLKSGGTLIAQPGLAYLKHFRKSYGMEGVKVVPYGAGAMAQFLDPARNDVAMQCFVFSEPITARRQGVEPRVLLIADTGFNPYTGVIITRGDYLTKNPDVAKRFALAMREGWRVYLDNPEPANEVMARINTAMDRKTFSEAAEAQKSLVEDETTKKNGLGTMTMERWKQISDQLYDLGVVSDRVPAAACFANP